MKRLTDSLGNLLESICAFVALVLLTPLFAVIALLIKLGDGGEVFYAHPRVGQNFSPFRLLKFRTMVAGADRMGGAVTVAGDPRVTRLGRVLRRYKLDELPQLVNVVRGELSLVGPRPEADRYVEMFRAQFAEILAHRPGITDPASLAYRDEEQLLESDEAEKIYVEEILPRKLELSAAYLKNRTLFSDVKILARTLLRIASPAQQPKR